MRLATGPGLRDRSCRDIEQCRAVLSDTDLMPAEGGTEPGSPFDDEVEDIRREFVRREQQLTELRKI
jgi:hypothetical protein